MLGCVCETDGLEVLFVIEDKHLQLDRKRVQ